MNNIPKSILDFALERKYKRIKEANEKGEEVFFLSDIETGIPYEVSKEYYDNYQKTIKLLTPEIEGKPIGCMIIFGTGGEIDNNYEKIFNY